MDIYKFLKAYTTSDIADYCRRIGHEFTPLEISSIISRAGNCGEGITVKERHEAYKSIIEEYPNAVIPDVILRSHHSAVRTKNTISIKSNLLADWLKTIILEESIAMDIFMNKQNDKQYYTFHSYGEFVPQKNERKYSTFEEMLKLIKLSSNSTTKFIIVEKKGSKSQWDIFFTDTDGNICSTCKLHPLDKVLLDIPVPFKVGDIVYDVYHDEICIVMESPFIPDIFDKANHINRFLPDTTRTMSAPPCCAKVCSIDRKRLIEDSTVNIIERDVNVYKLQYLSNDISFEEAHLSELNGYFNKNIKTVQKELSSMTYEEKIERFIF